MAGMAVRDIETEAKWRSDEQGHLRLRRALRRLGGVHVVTVREANTIFDTPGNALKRGGHILRLRSLDGVGTILTFKGPAAYRDGMKTREETELHVEDRDAMAAVLSGLGFNASLEYRKTRETWDLDGARVALDTLEFGRFAEIEGTEDQIRRAAGLLSLDLGKAEKKGYPALMRAYQERGRAAREQAE